MVVSKREKIGYYIFLAPAYIVFAVFIFGPMVFSFISSLFRYDIMTMAKMQFLGFRNYTTLFTTPVFRTAVLNTAVYTVISVPSLTIVGLGTAILINHSLITWKVLYKMFFYIPYISSMVAVSIVFSMLFNATSNGFANKILTGLGFHPIGWLSEGKWAMMVIILLSVWNRMGYAMVIYTGGLIGISREIYEAASLDAVSPFKKFFFITLPLLRPATVFLLVTETINSFQVFTPVQVITGGGPGYSTTTMVTYLYQKGFQEYKMGMASAIAVFLFVVLMILSIIQNRFAGRYE
jgi:ABC-type sugar transport system permease subunit